MKWKKECCLVIVLVFCLMLSGCKLYEGPYTFRQEAAAVEKVEICTYDKITKERTPIVELLGEDAKNIVSEFHAMDCHEYFPGDHPRTYGLIIFCIQYDNGETDVVGMYNIGWISAGGEWHLTDYYFDWAEMRNMVERYVPEEYWPEY